MEKELLLVKLPKIPNVDDEFFGIGYYTDCGFVFCLLTEKIISLQPLRTIRLQQYPENYSSCQFEILGIIKDLPSIN